MLAAMGGHAELIRSIYADARLTVEYLKSTDADGKTAIELAESAKSPATVAVLKEMVQRAQAEEQRQKMLNMARENDVAGLKGELERTGMTPPAELMITAATNGNTQVVRLLLENCKDKPIDEKVRLVGYPLSYGNRPQSAFHLAAAYGHLETLKALTDLEWWKDNATLADILSRKSMEQNVTRTPLESCANNSLTDFLSKRIKELEGKKK